MRYYFYGTTEADERLIECIATYVMGWLSGKIKEKMMKKIAKELPAILALGTVIGCLILFMIKG